MDIEESKAKFQEIFKYELLAIRDPSLKDDITNFISFSCDKEWFELFYTEPASSTGKYHPQKECEPMGLVYHSKAVFWIAKDLLRARPDLISPNSEYTNDEILTACLFHDFLKYYNDKINEETGKPHTSPRHPFETSQWVKYWVSKGIPKCPKSWERIASLILTHHGIWSYSTDRTTKAKEMEWESPHDEIHWLVHYADYVASRNFMDINFDKIYEPFQQEPK